MKHLFKLSFLVSVALGFALTSCKKDEDTPITPLTPGGIPLTLGNDSAQFHASLDGIPFSIQLDTIFVNNTDERTMVVGGDTMGRVYKTILQDTVLDEPAAWILLGFNKFIMTTPNHILPTESEFNSFFTTGMQTYADPGTGKAYFPFADTTEQQMRGAAFCLRDTVNDVIWTTQGPQAGSFLHVDTIAARTIMGQYHVKARMTFSCKLYDGSGAVRNLTNGVFIGVFRNG